MTVSDTKPAVDPRSNNFDFLRLAAAVAVLFSHCFPLAGIPGLKDPLDRITGDQISFGKLGVMSFFLISGYLISQSFENSSSVLRYIKARVFRVTPGLFMALLVSAFIIGPLATTLSPGAYFRDSSTYSYLRSVFLYPIQAELPGVFFLNSYKGVVNGSLWSIPFEVFYYGIVFLLGVFRLHSRKVVCLLLVVFVVLIDLNFARIFGESDPHLVQMTYSSLVHYALPFCCGMLVYSYRHCIAFRPVNAAAAILVIYYTSFFGGLFICGSIAGGYLLFYFALQGPVSTRRIARYGDFSYGVYLYAFPLQQLAIHLHGGVLSPYAQFCITLPLSFACAWCSWHLVEKPALRLKDMRFFPMFPIYDSFSKGLDRMDKGLFCVLGFVRSAAIPVGLVAGFGVMFAVRTYLTPPSHMEFPYRGSEAFFSGGWMPQVEQEKYRWVSGSAQVLLSCPKKAFTLRINGYVPPNFTPVHTLRVEVDGSLVGTLNFTGDGQINLSLPCEQSVAGGQFAIRFVFDGATRPGVDSPDVRKLSGFISLISAE